MSAKYGYWMTVALVVAACDSGDGGAGGNGAGGNGAGGNGAGGNGAGGNGSGACEGPNYSSNCAEVWEFSCGFEAHCEGSTIAASWHVHLIECGPEEIADYSCTYACPEQCDDDYGGWPADGQELIDQMCISGSGGSGGQGGGAGGGGG